ncbi:hypothetical protein [Pseudomonas jessenii]|uniref:hypothetical protein n=1 Tax=Pseudomonas jessenii TaxID=77298 RepID=UPI0038918DEF
MNSDTLKKLKLRDQLSKDHLKLLSLIEKTVLAYTLMSLVFIFMNKIGLTEAYRSSNAIAGTIGYLAMTIKLMYYDEALSELRTHIDISQETLKSAMLTIDYSEKKDGAYHPKKRMFSIFYFCKSELIIHTIKDKNTILTGPYTKLLKLSNIIERDVYS